jgi:Tfp pilus assembly protein PilV
MPRRTAAAALVTAAAIGMVACSDEDREEIGDAVGSVVEDVQDAANTLVSTVQEEAGEAVDAAAETAVRNVAAQAGRDAFAEAGHPIQGELTCEATATSDAAKVDVSCTGTTEAGGAAELTGQTDEFPGASVTEVSGAFTGTVDGSEVFTADALGA